MEQKELPLQETVIAEQERPLQQVRISVRNLVEFLLRSGDIDNRISRGLQLNAMQEGTRIHKKLQRAMGSSYSAEVALRLDVPTERYVLTIEGRADGIFTREDMPCIDEIKGIYQDVAKMEEPIPVHLAQAKCYAYIYALQQELPEIGVQMTYCDLDTEEVNRFYEQYAFAEIEEWFDALMKEYHKWADFQYEWHKTSIASIKNMEFPFDYRPGQKELVSDVYRTILRRKNLFIQAPTGTGKTVSVLFPAVRAVGEGQGEKIFYLTAKTVTATVAMETFAVFRTHGYRGKVVQITAKEKLCKCEKPECNPDACLYAKGHFDRVNDAVFDLLQQEDCFSREVLLEQADKHMVCPFELCLDVSSWSDVIVGDYNYVFDPTVYLKRFFAEGNRGDYLFLVDEAHNLVERGRQMYSERVVKEDVLAVKRLLKPWSKKVERELERVNKILLTYKRECEDYMLHESINDLVFALMRLASEMERFLQKPLTIPERDEVMEFYFGLRNFLNIYELVDENYVIYSSMEEDGSFALKLYCADPSRNLQACLDKAHSTVFFSGTLLPIQYYKSLLSTKDDNYAVYAHSVFTPDQRLLFVGRDVSSKYTRRTTEEFVRISSYIERIAQAKKGNYIAFFPSYKMMLDVAEQFEYLAGEQIDVIMQMQNMREQQREEFLQEFSRPREHSMVAFCVMGGIFGEGVDLREDQLIGAIIVGTGIPQIGGESEILKNFFDARGGDGFDYVYRFPGMNKVQQAAGRVIRTLTDVGVIALLDERFLQRDNRRLFPREWEDCRSCTLDGVDELLREFWKGMDA
ncbi:MAG: ATP-dependent DNA helicase [Eubacterium sp.]|nr:ATP-dependent DNA helicase [Eubacterium sp.]